MLLETKSRGRVANNLAKKFGFSRVEVAEANGLSGGIWIFWKDNSVNLEVVANTYQAVTSFIRMSSGAVWFFTAVYACPCPIARESLWDSVCQLSESITFPWLLGGDFNA